MVDRYNNQPTDNEERIYDLETFIQVSEKIAWPEGICIHSVEKIARDEKRKSRYELQRIATWTMAALLGAVTIYGIGAGDRQIVASILILSAGFLSRLMWRSHRTAPRGEDEDAEGKYQKGPTLGPARNGTDDGRPQPRALPDGRKPGSAHVPGEQGNGLPSRARLVR